MHAVARIALNPHVRNIQTSWVKMGHEGVVACLNAGANDLGGTLMNESITRAADLLRGGGLVAFPTETVYGLGSDASNAAAVASIFAAKGRPAFNPLISHVASASEAFALGIETPAARRLADAFWPGPMTLILQRAPNC